MKVMTEEQYEAIHPSLRGVWETERTDLPNWENERHLYMGKRTLAAYENGGTVLLIEGLSLEIKP
jgi:hypothetical protein